MERPDCSHDCLAVVAFDVWRTVYPLVHLPH
jgi:hypothetical protein